MFEVSVKTWGSWERGHISPPWAVVEVLRTKARGFETSSVRVPVLGDVPAGAPLLAVEEPEGWISVVPRGDEDHFALRVAAGSSHDMALMPGDLLICREQSDADPGNMVIVQIGDAVIAGRLSFKQGKPLVQVDGDPVRLGSGDRIVGKVVEARRVFEPAL